MESQDLIKTARRLTKVNRGRPMQASLRRAISTAYYAVFHLLARIAADLIVGTDRNEAWHQAHRALEHGSAKNACLNQEAMLKFPPEIQDFALAFAILQTARQRADYSLEDRYSQLDANAAINLAHNAIGALKKVGTKDRRRFVAHVLFKRRTS